MKKGLAFIVVLVLALLCVISWKSLLDRKKADTKAYMEYVYAGDENLAKGADKYALVEYEKAANIDYSDVELAKKIAQAAYNMGSKYEKQYVDACKKIISLSKDDLGYVMLARFYLENDMLKKAFDTVNDGMNNCKEIGELAELYDFCMYNTSDRLMQSSAISSFYERDGKTYYSVTKKSGTGIYSKHGECIIDCKYEYLGAYDDKTGSIPCKKDGELYYIDLQGYIKYVPDIKYDYLGSFSDGIAPVSINGNFGYIDIKMDEQMMGYTYAGAFSNGVAAVKKGDKWGLINTKFETITGFIYDEILCDDYGFCSSYNVIVAKKDKKAVCLDIDGEQLFNDAFDDARLAASNDGMVAVMKAGKWGFVNRDGDVTIDFKFEDAESFSIGLAPVKINGMWGYINEKGELKIPAEFLEASTFNSEGAAKMKKVQSWDLIILNRFK